MYIHIGNRKTVSSKKILGIFNTDTIGMSENNLYYKEKIRDCDSLIVIYSNNTTETSSVSPFTVIKRVINDDDFIWRKKNE